MAERSILIQGLIELHLKGEGGPQAVASLQKIINQAKEVEKATANIGAGASQASKGVGALDAAFASLGATVAGVFAAGVIANFLRDSYIGFARTERQARVTENQIRALGDAASAETFRPFIQSLSQATGILDDELIPAFQRAITVFRDYKAAQEAVAIGARFQEAGIKTTGEFVEALTGFLQTGRTQGLRPYISSLKDAEGATATWAQIIPQLRESLESLGPPLNDAQRKLDNIKNGFDFLRDSVGALTEAFLNLVVKGVRPALVGLSFVVGPIGLAARAGLEKLKAAQAEAEKSAKDSKIRLDAIGNIGEQEDKDRGAKAAKEKADKILDAEATRLEKVADLNERSAQELLKQQISLATEGSDERFALEIELNKRIEAAAIESAKNIGADTNAIAAFFARDRLRILNQRATDTEANLLGPGNEAGRDRFEKEVKAFQDAEEKKTEIAQREAAERAEIAADAAKWAIQQEQQKLQTTLASAGQIAGVLSQTFAKHKAFAIAMAIANTALGITAAWSDGSLPGYWAKLAATITIAASGAAQIAAIRGASIGGGGGASPGIAAAPSSRAQNPNDSQSATVAAQSSSDIAALSGRAGRSAPGGTVINIGTAFGDRQSMAKLAREINRVNANNQERPMTVKVEQVVAPLVQAQHAFLRGELGELELVAIALAVNDEIAALDSSQRGAAYVGFAKIAKAGLLARVSEIQRGYA